MVPVDHVARCTVLATVSPLPNAAMSVLHITANPQPTFNGLLSSLLQYGYPAEACEYIVLLFLSPGAGSRILCQKAC